MNLATMTDEEIQIAINAYYEEQQRRKRIKRENAINEFHHAFAKLREVGILPRYDDPSCMEMEAFYLESWDNFSFEEE